jgi:RNA polymerase sigma-70 factor (ECF subfamily)
LNAFLKTPVSLLARLKDRPHAADWARFVDIYGPVFYSWARRRGLQPQDAADVTQEVLIAVVGAIGRWKQDLERGRFRDWLWTVTRNKLLDFWRAEKRRTRALADPEIRSLLHQLRVPSQELQRDWDESYLGEVLARALVRLRSHFSSRSWTAFEKCVIHEIPPQQVSSELGMSLNAVYVAKSRVLSRLRTELEGLMD